MSEQIPTYKFSEDNKENLSPLRQKIEKTMEITETFNLYDVYKYVGSIDKHISDKLAEVKSLKKQKQAFLDEIELVEKTLGVSDLEKMYQEEQAKDAQVKSILEESDEKQQKS